MKSYKESEILKAKAKSGKIKYWKVEILKDKNDFYIRKEYWQDKGKHQTSKPYIVRPKNIGKANETTSKTQAIKEFNSIIAEQKKNYVGLDVDLSTFQRKYILPMLAQKYIEQKKEIIYPAAAQPKLDGVRCIYKTKLGHWSRKGLLFIPEVVQHIKFDTRGRNVDGELKLSNTSLQKSRSAITKYRKGLSDKLKYYIYDLAEEDLTFRGRNRILSQLELPDSVELVPTVNVHSEEEFFKWFHIWVEEGYEGAILRNWNGKYEFDHRSSHLLKYKKFQDAEFEIIGINKWDTDETVGKFICKVKNNVTFEANLKGTFQERRDLLLEADNLIGKMLTVRFQEYTDDGKPRDPVAIAVRDYE